ncbi:MAG: ATP-binding protein, partial [Kiritimatiellae bacterium]|nr:ATP-binding protein [Kiritimatiellia bacterium]
QFALAIENARLYTEVDDARRYNETLLQNVADGVIACDATGRITAVNREATRLLNIREDGPPTSLRELPPPVREALDHALAGSPPPPDLEARLPAEPAPHIVRVSARALRRSDGTPLGALVTLHDVTAERRFEERARRADRLASVGTLAASMAHEIKNPLVTIKTFIQLLPRAFDDPDLRASICPLIGTEVERIDMVVNRLLDFARPVQPTLTPLHLHEVLAQTLRLIDPRRRARNIRTIADLQADDDRILGDRALLEQVFVNLCFNAIEAMPHGGTLTLSSALVQVDSGQRDLWGQQIFLRRLRVSVRDTGIGIPPDVLPRIFDPFFTTKADGSGLGLTIAHGILQEHHATIDIESRPGAGTVVHVFFQPLETAAQEGNSA